MIAPLAIFASNLTLFVVMVVIVRVEERRARRLLGGHVRAWLDERIVLADRRITTTWHHFTQYILKLGWYYSIHSLLSGLMRVLVSAYNRIEHLFEQNRTRTKELRKEFKKHRRNSHLSEIASHKKETALTDKEQAELRHKKLEGDH